MNTGTVIIGSGPAGLAAAAFSPGGAVVLEEKKHPGWKILVSGNGRCNVTNTCTETEFLQRLETGSRPVRYALGAFGPAKVREWLSGLSCPTVVENGFEVFPESDTAASVRDALVAAAERNASQIRTSSAVTRVARDGDGFVVATASGDISCRNLIIAAGSPAWGRPHPELEEAIVLFGHTLQTWVPGLSGVPLRDNPFDGLDGISFRGRVRVADKWYGVHDVLVTSGGLSGPAVMNAAGSIFKRFAAGQGGDFALDMRGDIERRLTERMLLGLRDESPRMEVRSAVERFLPRRLAGRICEIAGASSVTASQLTRKTASALAAALHEFPCAVDHVPPLAKAFVASGGVPLDEVDMRTMRSKTMPGLSFAGEILDYNAPSGGFNITLALATGRLAGMHARA